jgi:hypothetical protein
MFIANFIYNNTCSFDVKGDMHDRLEKTNKEIMLQSIPQVGDKSNLKS